MNNAPAVDSTFLVSLMSGLDRTPFTDWQFDLAVTSAEQLRVAKSTRLQPDLRVRGPGSELRLGGRVDFATENGEREMRGTLYLLDEPVLAARVVEGKTPWLVVGPSRQPERIRTGEGFLAAPSVWPAAEKSVPAPSLDSSFNMNLALPQKTTPHER